MTYESILANPEKIKALAESIAVLEEMANISHSILPSLKAYMEKLAEEADASIQEKNSSKFNSVINRYALLSEFFRGNKLASVIRENKITEKNLWEAYSKSSLAQIFLEEEAVNSFKPVISEMATKLSQRQLMSFSEHAPKILVVTTEKVVENIVSDFLEEQRQRTEKDRKLLYLAKVLVAAVGQLQNVLSKIPDNQFTRTKEVINNFRKRFAANVVNNPTEVEKLAADADMVFSLFSNLGEWPGLEKLFEPIAEKIQQNEPGAEQEFENAFNRFFVTPVVNDIQSKKGWLKWLTTFKPSWPENLPDKLMEDMIEMIKAGEDTTQTASDISAQSGVGEPQVTTEGVKPLREDWSMLNTALTSIANAGKTAKATSNKAMQTAVGSTTTASTAGAQPNIASIPGGQSVTAGQQPAAQQPAAATAPPSTPHEAEQVLTAMMKTMSHKDLANVLIKVLYAMPPEAQNELTAAIENAEVLKTLQPSSNE
jgi:hypothetical protein